jgi:hypothetical protein
MVLRPASNSCQTTLLVRGHRAGRDTDQARYVVTTLSIVGGNVLLVIAVDYSSPKGTNRLSAVFS